MGIEAHEFEQLLKFWKPEEGREYQLVVFRDWKIKQGNFGQELNMKIVSADEEQYHEKDFSTKSSSFIVQIKPIILNAQQRGFEFVAVSLRYSNKKYTIFDRTDELYKPVRQGFGGVKLGPSA